jgi:titin
MLGITSGRIRFAARVAGHIGTVVLLATTAFGIGTVVAPPAHAALAATGPVDPATGFPSYYGDSTSLRLQPCTDPAPLCFEGRPNQAAPLAFPNNFPPGGEIFYQYATADIARPGGPLTFVEVALEGTFLPDVAPGNQVVFGRTRIRIFGLVPGRSYTVTYPYGQKTLTVNAKGQINDTVDVGCLAAPCTANFAAANGSEIGPFLQWDPAVAPAAPAGFIGSLAQTHPVIGSPLGTNFFRITGPDIGGAGVNVVETNLWNLAGKLSAVPPIAPGALTAAAGPGGGQITLNWSAPTDDGGSKVLAYRVYRGTATGALTFLTEVTGTTSFTDSGLPDTTKRFYAVSARNAVGEGARTAEVSATTFTKPGAPSGAAAVSGPGVGEVTVNWSPPATTGSGPLTGYRVYRGTVSGTLAAVADIAAGTTTFTDTGLPEGVTRFYAVTALGAAGEGLRSNEASATTFSRPTAPVSASATAGPGAGQVTLSWSAPASTGGSAITGYRVYGGSASGALTALSDVGAATRSFVDSALGNGTTKFYAVSALNAVGEGLRSNEASATTFTAPGVPLNLSVAAGPGGGQLALSWTAPSTTGGSGATSYRVYRSAPGGVLAAIADVTGGATTFTDSGLGDGATFSYAVSGINGVGEGTRTASVSGTTFSRPTAPRTVTATAGAGAGQVTLSWTAPLNDGGSPVAGYRVYRSVAGGAPVLVADITGAARSFTDSGLPDGATRSYTLTARNAAGEGVASAAATATTFSRPSVPQTLSAAAGVGQVSLQWTPPTSDGGSAISGYRVYAGPSAADLTPLTDLPSTARSFVESGLAEASSRTYAVTALNVAGESARSTVASTTTFARPAAPQGVTAAAGPANGGVTVQWSTPASDGGTAVTNYRILRGTSGADMTVLATVGNAARSFSDSGLPEGATRVYAVLAVNAVGDGVHSDLLAVTTFSRPITPDGFAVSAGPNNGELTLHWLAPASNGGRPVTGYRIYRGTTDGNLTLLRTADAAATSATDTALPEGATRFYAITAVNAVGESARTSTLSATVFARPTAPRAVTATGGPSVGRASVSWLAPASDGGRPVTSYRVYRSTLGSAWALAGVVDGSTLSFADSGLSLIGIHHYRVTAVNGVGESAASAEACALALPIPGSMPCSLL